MLFFAEAYPKLYLNDELEYHRVLLYTVKHVNEQKIKKLPCHPNARMAQLQIKISKN